jgi:hypothetical protein
VFWATPPRSVLAVFQRVCRRRSCQSDINRSWSPRLIVHPHPCAWRGAGEAVEELRAFLDRWGPRFSAHAAAQGGLVV